MGVIQVLQTPESEAIDWRVLTALWSAGCYDGAVYFLCVASGAELWVFETGDAVKSSPAVDPDTGLVFVGSHDGRLYALDPQVGPLLDLDLVPRPRPSP